MLLLQFSFLYFIKKKKGVAECYKKGIVNAEK